MPNTKKRISNASVVRASDYIRAQEIVREAFVSLMEEDRDCFMSMAATGELIVSVLMRNFANENLAKAVIWHMRKCLKEWKIKTLQ